MKDIYIVNPHSISEIQNLLNMIKNGEQYIICIMDGYLTLRKVNIVGSYKDSHVSEYLS